MGKSKRKADLILHPVRMRIILALAAGSGSRELTAQDLAQELPDVPRASLYRHLHQLADGGVVRVASEQITRGQRERIYALADAFIDTADLAGASREEHLQYFATFLGSLLGDFARYLERDRLDFAADGVGYRQFALYLTDEEFAALLQALDAALLPALSHEPAPGRRRRTLARIVLPSDVWDEKGATTTE